MARTRPQGRTKSDHRVCQAARHARAAAYRDRIEISAEKQEALIAAVNARCDAEPAPRRRRGQKSKGARAARGPSPVRPCRSSARAGKSLKRRLAQSLGEPTVKDPHSLHCHECGIAAEFGLRGSKEGGKTRYLCSAHSAFNGCFCIDKDRAVWVQDRMQRHLKAEVVRLEEELQKMDKASSSAEPAKSSRCLPVWNEASFKVALPSTKPMSRALLVILMMIGCIEINPGPSSDNSSVEDSRMEVDHPSIEADSQGEDIEDVEFNREKESSDEETSSIREFRDDSSQPSIAPVSEYARMDAELGHSNTEPEVRFEGGRRRAKRVGNEQSGESQPRRRRRRQVIMSSLSSSEAGAEAEANESGSEGAERSATSSEWGDLRNDDDPTWDGNDERDSEELREFFSVCRIDPRSGRDRREFLAPQAVFQHGESTSSVATITAAAAGPSDRDASMSAASVSATSALPTRATPRAAVQETTPSPQGPAVELPPQVPTTSTPQVPDPILAAAHYFHGLGVATVTHDLREKRNRHGKIVKAPCRWPSRKPWNEANSETASKSSPSPAATPSPSSRGSPTSTRWMST